MEIQILNLLPCQRSEACLFKTSVYSAEKVSSDHGEHLTQGYPVHTNDFYNHVMINT